FFSFFPPPSPLLSFVLIPVCTSPDSSFNLITSSTSKYFALSLSTSCLTFPTQLDVATSFLNLFHGDDFILLITHVRVFSHVRHKTDFLAL
ncbi:hypothetical protein B0H19DRAFT_1137489, partial [Mycena capillaripes]